MPRIPYIIPAGDLRQSVVIQAPTPTTDSFGSPQTTWTSVGTYRCKIEAITLREQFQQGNFTQQVTHRITLRYPGSDSVIKPGYRVVNTPPDGEHIYQIQALDNVQQRNRLVQFLALELNGAQ